MNDLTLSRLQPILPQMNPAKSEPSPSSSPSFGDVVKSSLMDVNRQMLEADQAIDDLATGKNQDIHQTMISMQKAEISFELVMQIRNKLIAAYDEIRRMSI